MNVDKKIDTIEVPFIPPFDADLISVKEASKYGEKLPDGFELHEIQGTRLVYFEDTDEWTDLGHKAIFRRSK